VRRTVHQGIFFSRFRVRKYVVISLLFGRFGFRKLVAISLLTLGLLNLVVRRGDILKIHFLSVRECNQILFSIVCCLTAVAERAVTLQLKDKSPNICMRTIYFTQRTKLPFCRFRFHPKQRTALSNEAKS
jgi:hypothetical protein